MLAALATAHSPTTTWTSWNGCTDCLSFSFARWEGGISHYCPFVIRKVFSYLLGSFYECFCSRHHLWIVLGKKAHRFYPTQTIFKAKKWLFKAHMNQSQLWSCALSGSIPFTPTSDSVLHEEKDPFSHPKQVPLDPQNCHWLQLMGLRGWCWAAPLTDGNSCSGNKDHIGKTLDLELRVFFQNRPLSPYPQ